MRRSDVIKILVTDDHSVVRTGLIKSLSDFFPKAVFGEAGNAADALRQVNQQKWDLVLLDINLPGRNGLEVLKSVKENCPDLPVIILSMYPADQFAIRAIKLGASAYITKETSVKHLAEAIRKIISGVPYLTPAMARIITSGIRHDKTTYLHEQLSDREFQVLLLLSSGKSVSDIAEELSLSVKTISVYRGNILKKMNLKNNAEIMHYAFKFNLVQK